MTDEILEARIAELQQVLGAIQRGEDAKSAIKARLEELYPADYLTYCNRWRHVPGDHAPGRLLDFNQWRTLTTELATAQANPTMGKRIQILQRALLLT